MKLNYKIYTKISTEAFEKQEIDGRNVELHKMEDSQFLTKFANAGKLSVWTSDGKNNYKLLIESGYYEALKPLYEQKINQIWLGYIDSISTIRKRFNTMFFIPAGIIYVIAAILSFAVPMFKDSAFMILMVSLLVILVGSFIQSSVMNKKIKKENASAQANIRSTIGEENFEKLIENQRAYFEQYYAVEDDLDDEENFDEVNDELENDDKLDKKDVLEASVETEETPETKEVKQIEETPKTKEVGPEGKGRKNK